MSDLFERFWNGDLCFKNLEKLNKPEQMLVQAGKMDRLGSTHSSIN
jgi:hypothetical protein